MLPNLYNLTNYFLRVPTYTLQTRKPTSVLSSVVAERQPD